jgi:tetratricopeptide (TPR) repeat protein
MTSALDQMLELAKSYYQAGQWQQAELLCRQALQIVPGHIETLNLLGLIGVTSGRPALARDCFSEMVRLQPDLDYAHNNLGGILSLMEDLEGAVAAYENAVRLQPANAEAHCNMGTALHRLGKTDQALASYRRAIDHQPNFADAHFNLANVLLDQGKPAEAVASYEQALQVRPDFADAYTNLGHALRDLGKLKESVASYERAARLRPDNAEFHYNMGQALRREDRLDEALVYFQRALQLRPDYAEAYADLAITYQFLGRMQEALANFEPALCLRPDYAEAHLAKASTLLAVGDFEAGWREYEWRFRWKEFPTPPLPGSQTPWDGTPLHGHTLLIRAAEQGLGDTLQFMRYASLLQESGGQVIVEAQPALLPLLRTCSGVAVAFPPGEECPPYDVYAYLMSIPGLMRTTLATIPAHVPYLSADPELIGRWRDELHSYSGFKIGICWQGNPKHQQDRLRSVPLARFIALAKVPGVQLFSLQVGAGQEQLAKLKDDFNVVDLGQKFDANSFADAAAVVRNMDLIITADTAIAHLAGALGAPVWVLLLACPDWRWLLQREDSPWYPTMRLFRQRQFGRWDAVFERITSELRSLLQT